MTYWTEAVFLYSIRERPRATRQPDYLRGCAVDQIQKYVKCSVCGQEVDTSVPKVFCAFCSIPGASECPWVRRSLAAVLIPATVVAGIPLSSECKPAYEVCQFGMDNDGGHTENKKPWGPLNRLTQEVFVTSTSALPPTSAAFGFGSGTLTLPPKN